MYGQTVTLFCFLILAMFFSAQVQFKPAAIIPQPTLAPLQLGREVTAYVGGHLMVADAKRITILCEASGIPVPEISWYRNGNKLPEHRRYDFKLAFGFKTTVFKLRAS